jgi:choline dehydrogenase
VATGMPASGFFRSLPGLSGPDLQVTLITSSLARRDAKGVELHGFSGFTMSAVVLQPLSRGSVKVSSADPAAMPRIQFNHLTHPQDRDTVLRGLSLVRKLARARSLSRYVQREHAPGDLADDSPALEGYVRRTGGSGYHSVGTCAMGTGADSVVDARLRVHGIDRLRIADASVMPRVTAGNTPRQ